MTQTLMSNDAIALINSLGGRPLPMGQNPGMAKVTLENFAATDIKLWELNAAVQQMQQTKRMASIPNKPRIGVL